MERKRLLYISCPYWDEDPNIREHRVEAATALAAELAARGYYAYSPITHGHEIEKVAAGYDFDIEESFWLEHSLKMLTIMAGSVLVLFSLHGHGQSKGMKAEYKMAVRYHRPVVGITYDKGNYWCHVIDPAQSYPPFYGRPHILDELQTVIKECNYVNVPVSNHS